MSKLETRLAALEAVDDDIEILNPRTWDLPPEERAAAELENQRRIEEAVRSGVKIIYIQNKPTFTD